MASPNQYWTALLTAVIILTSAACGNTDHTGDANWNTGANMTKVADTLPDYVRDVLTDEGMDQSQRDMLERALQHDGMVSRADYLTAWNNYRQCMVSKGYAEPPLTEVGGMYIRQQSMDINGLTAQQQDKLEKDGIECRSKYVLQVDTVYRIGQGNPGLYSDPATSLVDCLRRRNLVPKDYTVERFRREEQAQEDVTADTTEELHGKMEAVFTFDTSDPQVLTCVVANDPVLVSHRLTPWRPYG